LSNKPRLLIPITIQFSVRYLIRTGLLERIQEYAKPVIVLAWEDPELQQELETLGVEVYQAPPKKIGVRYSRLLHQLTQWHLRSINTPTTKIDRRRYRKMNPNTVIKLRRSLRDGLYRIATGFPPYVEYLLKQQERLVWQDTNLHKFVNLIKQIKPDLGFCLTPYFLEEELLLRAAEYYKIPLSTAILSFDNLTTRAYIPVKFDAHFLWNQYNQAELHRIYPEATDSTVVLVGAPQFDFYYQSNYIWSESTWRSKLRLPPDRKVILFGSASKLIAYQEEQWLRHLDEAIEQGNIQDNPVILFRRHPVETFERWNTLKSSAKHIIFDEPWQPGKMNIGKTNISQRDIERLASTLYHCAVHINASSTMTVDGAIFDRPQIGPAYDEEGPYARIAKDIYLREHYLPITHSGGLVIVNSRSELIQVVNNALKNPNRLSDERKKLVREICTFTDGKCTDRVNQALCTFVEKTNIELNPGLSPG